MKRLAALAALVLTMSACSAVELGPACSVVKGSAQTCSK